MQAKDLVVELHLRARPSRFLTTAAKKLKMSGAARPQPYVLFGLGGVGRGLLRALLDAREKHGAQYGLDFAALALCDSRGALGDGRSALAPAAVRAAHDAKEAGGALVALAGGAYVARGAGVSAASFLEVSATLSLLLLLPLLLPLLLLLLLLIIIVIIIQLI